MKTTLDIQRQLKARGFDPGPVDGEMGPRTRDAIQRFQMTIRHLKDTGYPDAETVAVLFHEPIEDEPASATPWMGVVLRKKGLHESVNYAAVSAFLRSDGKTLGDPRNLPWCGDLVETAIALTLGREGIPSNPYLARNWLKFGIPCEPRYGAVAVYWRGSRNGTSGHVAFIAGQDGNAFVNLGGNQSNRISLASLAKNRLLGCRWPRTVPLGRTRLPQMKGGQLSVNEA